MCLYTTYAGVRRWVKWPQNKPEEKTDFQSGNISRRGLQSFSVARPLQEKWVFFQKPSWGWKKQWSGFGIWSDHHVPGRGPGHGPGPRRLPEKRPWVKIIAFCLRFAGTLKVPFKFLKLKKEGRKAELRKVRLLSRGFRAQETEVTLTRWTEARKSDVPSRTSALRLRPEP